MKAVLFTAVTIGLFCVAACCLPPFVPERSPEPTRAPAATPCPPGVPVADCFADPCQVTTCRPYPDATCKANYCGGCNAVFYDRSDREVNCNDPYCPSGQAYMPGIFCGRGENRQDCPSTHSCQVHPLDFWAVCCPNEAGMAGECPDTTGMIGTCVEECSGDRDCTEGEKCCSNGCGHVCMDVIRG